MSSSTSIATNGPIVPDITQPPEPDIPDPSQPPVPTAPTGGDPLSAGAEAGIAIGVLIIAAIIGLGVFFYLRRKRRNSNVTDVEDGKSMTRPGVAEMGDGEKYELPTEGSDAPLSAAESTPAELDSSHQSLPSELPTREIEREQHSELHGVSAQRSTTPTDTLRNAQPSYQTPTSPKDIGPDTQVAILPDSAAGPSR